MIDQLLVAWRKMLNIKKEFELSQFYSWLPVMMSNIYINIYKTVLAGYCCQNNSSYLDFIVISYCDTAVLVLVEVARHRSRILFFPINPCRDATLLCWDVVEYKIIHTHQHGRWGYRTLHVGFLFISIQQRQKPNEVRNGSIRRLISILKA